MTFFIAYGSDGSYEVVGPIGFLQVPLSLSIL